MRHRALLRPSCLAKMRRGGSRRISPDCRRCSVEGGTGRFRCPLLGVKRTSVDRVFRYAQAPSLGVELRGVDIGNAGEIERAITAFAASSNGGLIITVSNAATVHRDLIIALAARHRLPAVYYARYYVTDGGLISYGPDLLDQCRRAAGYVDRILKGDK